MVAPPYDGIPVRRVMHCDLDCFFAAVEELDDPSLVGRPVVVGGDPDRRGVVSTANYAARRYGIHSAMAAALARRLCPRAVFLRPRFERYRELSRRVMAILDDYFVVREQVSIDEAYGELPPAEPGCRPAEQIAREIKARVRAETGLTISVGVARSKSIAKLASDLSKPDGCLVVRPGSELAFLRPLPVGRLGGVGPHTRERLERMGIMTVGQLAERGERELVGALGRHGQHLWLLATARDDRPVVGEHGPPKSVSRERTYERDIADIERAAEQIRWLAGKVARDAAEERVLARSVHIKVKWSDFRLMTRQRSLEAPVADEAAIGEAALALLRAEVAPLLDGAAAIRLLGVGLGAIVPLDAVPERGDIVQLPLWSDAVSARVRPSLDARC